MEKLGNIYREANKTQLALETYRKIVDLGGDEATRGYQIIIETYRDQKQWADATRVARKWIRPRQWPVVVVGPIGGAADALQALALGEVRLHRGPGVLEVRAAGPQSPAGAKGPTAGTVREDEAQTGTPPAAAPPPGQAGPPPATQPPSVPPPPGPAGRPGPPEPGPPAQTPPTPGAQQPPPSARP